MGWTVEHFGWDAGFGILIGGSAISVVLLLIVAFTEKSHKAKLEAQHAAEQAAKQDNQ